jgi:hypothetical protein
MSNFSSGKVIKEDREYILEDVLVLDLAPLPSTRARLWELVGLSRWAVKPRSTSADLSLENSSFTVSVVYFSDSRMASTFPSHMVRSSACKSFQISPHVVHNHCEPLEQGINLLTGKMSEVLVLSPVGCIQPCMHSLAPTKCYKLSPLSEPDQIRTDTEHETSSRPPCCWRRTCPLILEQGT